MNLESLLSAVVETMESSNVSSIADVPMPHFDATVNLGTPSEALKKAKADLDRQEKEAVVDIEARIADVRESIKSEEDVINAGDYDINTEMAKPDFDRDALAQRRAAAEVAIEVREVKRRELENLKDERDQIVTRMRSRSNRLMEWLRNTEVATRAQQISFIRQNGGTERLNAEKTERSFSNLLSLKKFAAEVLGEELAAEVVESITTFPIPATYEEVLWAQLTTHGKRRFEDHQPLATMLNTTGDA